MKRLILMAHGSRDPEWRTPFEKFAEELKKDYKDNSISIAYMQFASPALEEVIEESFNLKYSELKILPLFMAQGGHMKRDIPEQIKRAQKNFPELKITLLPHIGANPKFWELLKEIIKEGI